MATQKLLMCIAALILGGLCLFYYSRGEPAVSSSEPAVSRGEPAVSSGEPAVSSSKPAVSRGEPAVSSGERAISSSKPAVSRGEPAFSSGEPAVSSSKPADPSGDATTLSSTVTLPWDTIASVGEMYKHMVIATSFSSNHFEEAKDMIASVQKCFPNKTIIVYDLGLKPNHKTEVSSYCNVELRPFPFDEYPPHVKQLHNFAWKPIIVKRY